MSMYGLFSPSIAGLKSQSHALDVIGYNIANVNTGGFKRTDTHFETVLSDTLFQQKDLGGTRTKDFFRISDQGQILASQVDTDLAISGDGFFVLNTQRDGSGDTLYTRDGSFRMEKGPQDTITTDDKGTADPSDDVTADVDSGYLVDKNGYYLQGWAAADDGTFSNSGAGGLQSLRIDPFAYRNEGQATTEATLAMNLDANEQTNGSYTYYIDVYDSNGKRRTVDLQFTKNAPDHEWSVDAATSDSGATVNSATGTLTFGGDGQFSSVTPAAAGNAEAYTVDITWGDGATNQVAVDMGEMTQFAGQYNPVSYQKDGRVAADMVDFRFDSLGHVVATFEDNSVRNIYKVPLANFRNPDGLDVKNGMVFQESQYSGEADIVAAGRDGHAIFTPNALEISNVNVEDQFSKLIMTQQAYNASATSFKTMDEMTQVAKELKR